MNETQLEAVEVQERRSRLLWPVRFLLRLIVKAIVLVFLAIRLILRPRVVRYGVVALLVLGFAWWQLWGQSSVSQGAVQARGQPALASASTGARTSTTATDQLMTPAPVVEQYLMAQASFDAPAMWAAIGDDLKQQLAASGTTVEDLQGELNAAKDSGRKYGQATYVAGSQLQDGANAYFYVITVDTGSGTMKVPYIYVVGGDGKIASIQ